MKARHVFWKTACCFAVLSMLSSCMQLRPYTYFVVEGRTPFYVRARIAVSAIELAQTAGASCKVLSKEENRTACDFSGENFSVDLIVVNPKEGELMILISDEIGFLFPPDSELVSSGGYLGKFYLELERSIVSAIPKNTPYTAKRGYTGSESQEADTPWHDN